MSLVWRPSVEESWNPSAVDAVQRLPDGVEAVDFDHDVDDTGLVLVHRRADGQAVVPLVDTEESHTYRTEFGRRRHPERAARAETQDAGVEVEQTIRIHRRHHHVAEPLVARDEPRAERGDHRTVVEHRAVENLQRRIRRIGEGDHFLDPALVGLGRGQLLEHDTGGVQVGFDFLQRGVVAHFPADRQNPVDVAGDDDDARRPLIHPQVQG